MFKQVELYNIFGHDGRAPRATANGFLVRVVDAGRTTFVKFGRDEAAARAFAASSDVEVETRLLAQHLASGGGRTRVAS